MDTSYYQLEGQIFTGKYVGIKHRRSNDEARAVFEVYPQGNGEITAILELMRQSKGQYVWQGFSDHRESEKGYGWTYTIWAPFSCSLPDLEGIENQQFFIEKIEKYEPDFGVTEYDIYVQHNSHPQR